MSKEKKSIFSQFLAGFREGISDEAKPYVWDKFMEYISDELDKKILNRCEEKKLEYVGGKCRFTPTVEKKEFSKKTILNVDAELYFKLPTDDEKNIERYPLHTERNYEDFNLEDEETVTVLRELIKNPLEVTVAKPEK